MISSDFLELEIAHVARPIPLGLGVIEKSVPISCFGEFESAKVATLSLNPSYREFTDSKGTHLVGPNQRLTSRHHLGVESNSVLSSDQAREVISSLRNYFKQKPYMPWFSKLETWALPAFGASYLNGTAAHLDLSQWATNPIWNKLSDVQKQELLKYDLPFLKEQLRAGKFETVLLNGKRVISELQNLGLVSLRETDVSEIAGTKIMFYEGVSGSTRFLGWNWYLQSAIATEIRKEIFRWLKTKN